MKKVWEFIKKTWEFIKKFWWAILMALGFIVGLLLGHRSDVHTESEKIRKLKEEEKAFKKEQERLKKEQEKLEKEAEEIEKKKYFDNVDDASKYINRVFRKRK